MSFTLNTDRLILRPWRKEDGDVFAALNADPEVMQYLGGPMTRRASDDAAAAVVTECAQKSSGTERPFSEKRSNAAVVASARTVASPSTVTARHALDTFPDSP